MWRHIQGVERPEAKKRKSEEEVLQTKRKYDKETRVRSFQNDWKAQHSWLSYSESEKKMTCTICIRYDNKCSFTSGCTNFKKEAVIKHANSEGHLDSVLKDKAQNSSKEESVAKKSLLLISQAARQKLRLLFANAHYIAKQGKPYSDFPSLCKLDKGKGLDIGNTYTTDRNCQKFITAIAGTIQNTQDTFIKNSRFISIISDGATDVSSKEAEIMLIRSVVDGKIRTHFLAIRNVPKADAETISNAISSVLTERYDSAWKQQLVGMGTDGASVMMGKKAGVIQRMRELTQRPFVFAIHCSAHRLELAYKDAMKSCKSKLVEKADALLLNLYLFYKYSPLNRANLKASFDCLGMKMMIPTRVGGTRWLPHTQKALKHVLYGYEAITNHLEQLQNPNDAAHRKDSACKAKNFLKLLGDKAMKYWLHVLLDVVACLSKTSEAIQQNNACLSDVWNELQSTRAILQKYMDSDGPYARKAVPTENVLALKEKFVSAILTSLSTRFEGDLHLFKNSSFVSFNNWPSADQKQAVADYADEEVREVAGVCKQALMASDVEVEEIEPEWTRFKVEVLNNRKKDVLTWESLWPVMAPKYPNLFALIDLLLTLPSSSVDAERGFSRIVVLTSLECDDDYYGQLCDVFCQNSTGYYCSENGTRECLPGFSGPDCDEITTSAPSTSTAPPTIQTTTESKTTVTVVTSQASSTASTSRVSALSPATTEGSSTPPVSVSSLATTDQSSPPSTSSSTVTSTMTSTSQTTTFKSQGPVCYTCSEMGHLIYCDAVEQCKPNEVCFVSKYFRSGHPVYHSGCLPKEICTVQAYLSANLTNECVECCTDDFCNNKGCGDDAYQDPSVRGPLCLDCRHVSDPAECRTVALCQRHQLCSIEEYQWGEGKKYNLGCASPLCLSLSQSGELSRRSLPTCHSCCAEDHCNRKCVTGSPGSVQGGVLVG